MPMVRARKNIDAVFHSKKSGSLFEALQVSTELTISRSSALPILLFRAHWLQKPGRALLFLRSILF